MQEICNRALQVESRNTRYQSTAQLMLAAPWSFSVLLHCAFLWRQCQLLVQLSNVSDSKQKQILHLSKGRLEKTFEKTWNFLRWIQFQVLQNLAVTQPLSIYCNWACLSSLGRLKIQNAVNALAKWHRSPSWKTGVKSWVGFGFTRCIKRWTFMDLW